MRAVVSEARVLTALLSCSPWNVDVGREVVAALRSLGAPAVPELARLLEDTRAAPVARMAAARLLAQLGGAAALAALGRVASGADDDVALHARTLTVTLPGAPCAAA